MVNLKDNFWIEGFDIHEVGYFMRTKDGNFIGDVAKEIVYSGNASDIPEEIAKECVDIDYSGEYWEGMWQYSGYRNFDDNIPYDHVSTAKESIQSACNQEYCIIFKK